MLCGPNPAKTPSNEPFNNAANSGLPSGVQTVKPIEGKDGAKKAEAIKQAGHENVNNAIATLQQPSSSPVQLPSVTSAADPSLSKSTGATEAAETKANNALAGVKPVAPQYNDNHNAKLREMLGSDTEFKDPSPTGQYTWIPSQCCDIPPFCLVPAMIDKRRTNSTGGMLKFGSGEYINVTLPDPNSGTKSRTLKMMLAAISWKFKTQGSKHSDRQWFLLLLNDAKADFHFAAVANCVPAGGHCPDEVGLSIKNRLEQLTAADLSKIAWIDRIQQQPRYNPDPAPAAEPDSQRGHKRPGPDPSSTLPVPKRMKTKRGPSRKPV